MANGRASSLLEPRTGRRTNPSFVDAEPQNSIAKRRAPGCP